MYVWPLGFVALPCLGFLFLALVLSRTLVNVSVCLS